MIKRLQTQLIFLFIAFTAPALVSISVTYWGLKTQQQDALVINLAGRQRIFDEILSALQHGAVCRI